jgi:hypothetical protein
MLLIFRLISYSGSIIRGLCMRRGERPCQDAQKIRQTARAPEGVVGCYGSEGQHRPTRPRGGKATGFPAEVGMVSTGVQAEVVV